MAYRIGKNTKLGDMYEELYRFLREMTSISEINYESSIGDGELSSLSVPASSSTTETWTLVCTQDSYPAVFSVSGNITGNTADATVDAPYNNGIINFTIRDGNTAWNTGDIISFSTKTGVHTPWTPRTIDPSGDLTRAPRLITAVHQKLPQYGSEYFGANRGSAFYIDGPKEGSSAMRPTKMHRYSWNSGKSGYLNHAGTFGGTISTPDLSASDANAPQEFTMQVWVRNPHRVRGTDTYNNAAYGEVIYSVTDRDSRGGTPFIRVSDKSIQVGAETRTSDFGGTSDYYVGALWSVTCPIEDFTANGLDTVDGWFLISVAMSKVTKSVTVYLNDSEISTFSGGSVADNIGNTRPVIGGIGSTADVADIVIWRTALTQSQIAGVYNSPTAVDAGAPEIYDAFTWKKELSNPVIDVENKDSRGNLLTAQLFPQAYPFFSYRLSSIRQSAVIRHNPDPELQLMNSAQNDRFSTQWNEKDAPTKVFILGANPYSTIVDKYWFVATNEYVSVVFKIYDQSTQQQLPVYQSFYIGRGDSLQDKVYTVVSGTRNTANDYWYTGDTTFRSGFIRGRNVQWFGQWYWQHPTHLVKSPYIGAFSAAGNSYNIWSIYHRADFTNSTPDSLSSPTRVYRYDPADGNQYLITGSYGEGFTPEEYGTFLGVYGVQAQDTAPEDIILIEGEEYLAFPDCTQSGADSMLLMKLG